MASSVSVLPAAASIRRTARSNERRHPSAQVLHRPRRPSLVSLQAKKGFDLGKELLDVMEGGPKLRKWYGAGERMDFDDGEEGFPTEPEEPQEEEPTGPREVVLVTEAASPIGEAVVFQLILQSRPVKVLAADAKAISDRFGPYVKAVVGSVDDKSVLKKALGDVEAVVCTAKVGQLPSVAAAAGVEHIVLLSATPGVGGGLGGLLGSGEDKQRTGPEREEAVRKAGVPFTIVRAGSIRDAPGGREALAFTKGGTANGGAISREDAAVVCVKALGAKPASSLEFDVVGSGPLKAPTAWDEVFAKLGAK